MLVWLIPLVTLALVLLAGLFLYVRARQRRKERLERRLLAGRQQLLGEELARRQEALDSLDVEGLETLCREAEAALDELHVLLVERQAHLLNYEDLVRLQQLRLSTLEAESALPAPPPSRQAPDQRPAEDATPRDRRSLENKLLDSIGRRQKGKRPPQK